MPDSLIMEIMEARLQEPDARKGFILDGFPRTIPQAQDLKKLLEKLGIRLDVVVDIEVPKDVILDRLTTRRTCSNPDCQEIYNVKSKPRVAGGQVPEVRLPGRPARGRDRRRRSPRGSRPITRRRRPLSISTGKRVSSRPSTP